MTGLAGVPLSLEPLNRKEFASDQEIRWCPGCGDYAILATFQQMMAALGIRRENTVLVSGIGCAARFPYYVDSYGMHSIHGRALPIATGIAMTRPDLNVWVISGDGDALSIGGNHLIHALRRNVNVNVLLFNNRIYGLTKGQYSPTSEAGKVTKSTPLGSLDFPFNPVSLALGAEASFVARALDTDRHGLSEVLTAAANHRGSSLVEIYQNCPIFNDDAYAGLKGPAAADSLIPLREGEPIIFGVEEQFCVVRKPTGELLVTERSQVSVEQILIHDPTKADPSLAFALSRLDSSEASPIGVFRRVQRPAYDDLTREQLAAAATPDPAATLAGVIAGNATWEV